jgi:hypothetical protein
MKTLLLVMLLASPAFSETIFYDENSFQYVINGSFDESAEPKKIHSNFVDPYFTRYIFSGQQASISFPSMGIDLELTPQSFSIDTPVGSNFGATNVLQWRIETVNSWNATEFRLMGRLPLTAGWNIFALFSVDRATQISPLFSGASGVFDAATWAEPVHMPEPTSALLTGLAMLFCLRRR